VDWAKNPDKPRIFENPPGQRPKKRMCPGKPGRMITLAVTQCITIKQTIFSNTGSSHIASSDCLKRKNVRIRSGSIISNFEDDYL